ncbi:transcription factor CSA-like [Punica granatum]|uniref:Transcription factor CSA-like n=1 Tax=Punica granatum TaxID=22663 RepID=A0A6P8D6A8_PUNGR|nr:transcription factor CSA-like [Punica granatum]
MSKTEHLKTRLGRFTGFQDLNSLPSSPYNPPLLSLYGAFPGAASLGERKPEMTEAGFQFLAPAMGQTDKAWAFEPLKSRGGVKTQHDVESDGHGGKADKTTVRPGLDEEDEVNRCSNVGKGGHVKLCARGHWRPAEDAKLKELVAQFGPQNWNVIAEHLEGRSGKSCRLRWFNQLDPRINRKAFSEEEEERLLTAHRMYGSKWAMIARLFPGRTDNAVKNHWHVIMARKQREQSNVYRKRKLLPPHMAFDVKPPNRNTSSTESTISSNRDESASTCTKLSLSASSARPVPVLFGRSGPVQRLQPSDPRIGPPNKKPLLATVNGPSDDRSSDDSRNWTHCTGPKKGSRENSGSGNLDSVSNSEVSGAESVTTHNLILSGPEKQDLPFIDFLGVGAT